MRRCAQCQVDYPDALEFCPTDGLKLPPLPGNTQELYDPLIGSTIDGRYFVDSVLGEGGMGIVYAGRHAIIDKRVAIKVLRKEAATDESAAQRFLAEAKAASKIDQQNIVDITDFGVLPDGHAYFIMEFLDGITLASAVAKGGPMAPAAAVSIAIQVARGLGAAHGKGIIHRDLKPENVFIIERDGLSDFVKIVDFGIARDAASKKRLTVAGMVMGTPEYMAPEQASGQETDHRVDQYALGCILYESLTGVVPFLGENAMQTLTKHVFEPLIPPTTRRPDLTIPPPLEAVIVRALQKKRDDRYADMDAMMRALQEVQPLLQGIAVPITSRPRPQDDEHHGSATISDVDLDAAVRPRRAAPLLMLGGGIIVVIGVAAFALRDNKPHADPTVPKPVVAQPIPRPPTPTTLTPTTPTQIPTADANVELTLRSVPDGAEVFLGDERLGNTPTTSSQPRSDKNLHFVFRHSGYKDATREVPALRDAYLDVTLVREVVKPTHVALPAPPPPLPVHVSTPVATPKPAAPALSVTPTPTTPTQSPKPKRTTPAELRNPFD